MTQEATKGRSDGATKGRAGSLTRHAIALSHPPLSCLASRSPHSAPSSLRRSVASSLPRHCRPAFTIAEIIVAIVITGFLAGATVLAINQAAKARDASVARVEAHLRADTAAARIAADIQNVIRDPEVVFTRVLITNRADRDEILVFARSPKLVRPRSEQGEGGEYEFQYRVEPILPGVGPTRPANAFDTPFLALWRRADPVPDEYPDAGGVAAAVVTGIVSLTIKAYDGKNWLESWDSDYSGYPHAVSISVVATDDAGRYQSTSRRLVALDRTPLPEVPVELEEDSADSSNQQP